MIPAKYIIANNFSNGLACVREKGRYGYINLKGGYSIPPKYDFAYPFVEGFAIVYIKGRPSFINLKGENLLIGKYKQINNFKNGYAFVKTWSGKVGIVNKKGELIVDIIYSQFRETTEGNYIVTKWISPDSNFTIEIVMLSLMKQLLIKLEKSLYHLENIIKYFLKWRVNIL